MKKIGVFLGRFQPIHNAHLRTIRKMLKENEEAYIVIGSSEKNCLYLFSSFSPYPYMRLNCTVSISLFPYPILPSRPFENNLFHA